MQDIEKQGYIFGGMFALANRLQVIGDQFDENITIKQWLFLASVARWDGNPTISEIAQWIGYSRQNAKRIASDLAEKGFVVLQRDEKDARAWRVILTEKFFVYFEQRAAREDEFMAKVFDGFDEELTDGLYQGLLRLTGNIEQMERGE